jgi:hypothetical protein
MNETIIKICEEAAERLDRALPTSSLGQWKVYRAFYTRELPDLAVRLTEHVNAAIEKDPEKGHEIKDDAIEALRNFREKYEPTF